MNKTPKNKLQKHDTFTTSILFFLFGQPKWNTTHGPAAACLSQALLGNRFPHPFKLLCPPTGRVSLVRTTALRLEALQMDDQGSYDCRILLLNESADELQNGTWIRLSVTGKALNLEGFFCFFVCFLTLQLWLRVDYIELCEARALIQIQNVNNILAPVACQSKDRLVGRRVFYFLPNSYEAQQVKNKH